MDHHIRTLSSENPALEVERHLVDTAEEAEKARFRGSPSVLLDGVDPFADADTPVGLSCRVYDTPEGPAGSPTIEQLRAALSAR